MTTSRSGLRRAVTGALVLPLTGLALVATAPAASAAPTAPGNGTVFTSYSSFTISADYGRSTSENRLTLTSPAGSTTTIATAPGNLGGGTLSYTMDTGCWGSSGGCDDANREGGGHARGLLVGQYVEATNGRTHCSFEPRQCLICDA